jgi:hypothetical protein
LREVFGFRDGSENFRSAAEGSNAVPDRTR